MACVQRKKSDSGERSCGVSKGLRGVSVSPVPQALFSFCHHVVGGFDGTIHRLCQRSSILVGVYESQIGSNHATAQKMEVTGHDWSGVQGSVSKHPARPVV